MAGDTRNTAANKTSVPSADALSTLKQNLRSPLSDTRCAALRAIIQDPERALLMDVLVCLRSTDGVVRALAAEALDRYALPDLEPALERLVNSRLANERCLAVCVMSQVSEERSLPLLRQLVRDRAAFVRAFAVRAVGRVQHPNARVLLVRALDNAFERVRAAAAAAMCVLDIEWAVSALIHRVRTADPNARSQSLLLLADLDDPRVIVELAAAMHDRCPFIRCWAEELLRDFNLPALRHFPTRPGQPPIWQQWQQQTDDVKSWLSRTGAELLGRTCIVHQFRAGLGRTWRVPDDRPVQIEINNAPITSQHPDAEPIMRGLGLHEFAHHLYDIGQRGSSTMKGLARSRGAQHIYDLLIDERIERALRARRPEWGPYFDKLASYAFAQDETPVPVGDLAEAIGQSPDEIAEAVCYRRWPGRIGADPATGQRAVFLKPADLLRIPGLLPPLVAFCACLRCGFDPQMHPNRIVAEAIACVPSNLKSMRHADVLKVAERISGILGRDAHHRRMIRNLRKSLSRHQRMRLLLGRVLDRLAQGGALPRWLKAVPGERVDLRPAVSAPRAQARLVLSAWAINLGNELGFDVLDEQAGPPPDSHQPTNVLAVPRGEVHRLRRYLLQLGTHDSEEFARLSGRRIDMGAISRAVFTRSPNLLVRPERILRTHGYLGLLIDRSSSMMGEHIERAKAFAMLISEAAKGARGIEGHVSAFDDQAFYRLGTLTHNSISAVQAANANNDAGALACAAGLARQSQCENKALIMISDGLPTKCTFASLANLVSLLTHRYKIECVQVALARSKHVAFPEFVDLSEHSFEGSVTQFSRLLRRVTAAWR